VEPTWLEVNRCTIPVCGLPAACAGLRIAHLSDFHCSRHVSPSYVREAADLAQAQHADVVVLTGDYVHHGYRYVDQVTHALGRLCAPLGVFAVLGNHDYSVRNALGFRRYRHLHRTVARGLRAQGIRVLHNESVRLRRGGGELCLVGVEDLWSGACDLDRAFAGVTPDVPCVALAHHPRTVHLLTGRRCDLMLCGHTHGGQVRWPRPRRAAGRAKPRFTAGHYTHQTTHLYVNKGVGFGTFRFRYGVRPEVAVLTLEPAPEDAEPTRPQPERPG
jgi:predicted MPP superfamily phosphohydrolase